MHETHVYYDYTVSRHEVIAILAVMRRVELAFMRERRTPEPPLAEPIRLLEAAHAQAGEQLAIRLHDTHLHAIGSSAATALNLWDLDADAVAALTTWLRRVERALAPLQTPPDAPLL